jgi:ADP-heptose:LPS heptosyltransferase
MRILLIRLGQVGDTIFTSAVVAGLCQHYGKDVDITFLVKHGSHVLFEHDPRLTVQTIAHRRIPVWLNPSKWRCVIRSWRQPYDLVLNMQLGHFADDLMCALRVSKTTGRKLGQPYSNIDPSDYQTMHTVEANVRYARDLLPEVSFSTAEPRLYPQSNTKALLLSKELLPQQYIVLNPGNSHVGRGKKSNHRAWPMTHWRELFTLLGQLPSIKALVNCAPGEEALLAEMGELPDNIIVDSGSGIMDLIAYLDQAALLISTDTGTVHMAAALNTPILGLYGPTNAVKTGAYPADKEIFTIMQTDMPCQPCINTPQFKACKDNQCMQRLTPVAVFTYIRQFVQV